MDERAMYEQMVAQLPGNSEKYSLAATAPNPSSPLKGKAIIFLGSSVVYGSDSLGESMADFLGKIDGVNIVKEAVSGTTLVERSGDGGSSYIARMKTIDQTLKPDAFICQLSTNDATQQMPLGDIARGFDPAEFDTGTITGAIEYIIAYARRVFGCPIIFFTGTRYSGIPGADLYARMVARLHELSAKWNIGAIDLWNDESMLSVTPTDYALFMSNPIHPTRAGYRDWWVPKFESFLTDLFA